MKETFVIKKEHLELLKNVTISWWGAEFGAPCIDPKRPYGNGDVYQDMAQILNIPDKKRYEEDDVYYTPEEEKYMDTLHKDLKTVLEIGLCLLKFEIGTYQSYDSKDSRGYGVTKWKKIK